jgi:two-component system, OmpR family, sensor histidine kinase VicK
VQKGFGSRSPLVLFVLINIAWLGLVALWVYYSVNNYQTIKRISLRLQFGPSGVGSPWVALFGAGILMLFLLLGIIVIFVYYRKQAALNLVHQNFISSVTHELRSPLASLQLYLETLVFRNPEDRLRKEFLGRMQEETERLSALIQNILWVSRVQRFKIDYAFDRVPLSTRLGSYLEEKRKKHGWSGEQLVSDLEPDVWIRCDWENLKIAFDNLVENAIRYSPSGFWLRVSLERSGGGCRLSFQDRGVGIPKAAQKQVFKMFYRAGREMTRTVKGTGLGLYIVKNVITAHGGKVSVRSEGKQGGGATFLLDLPESGPRSSRFRTRDLLSVLPFRRV